MLRKSLFACLCLAWAPFASTEMNNKHKSAVHFAVELKTTIKREKMQETNQQHYSTFGAGNVVEMMESNLQPSP